MKCFHYNINAMCGECVVEKTNYTVRAYLVSFVRIW